MPNIFIKRRDWGFVGFISFVCLGNLGLIVGEYIGIYYHDGVLKR
jgi:hypothetical protein